MRGSFSPFAQLPQFVIFFCDHWLLGTYWIYYWLTKFMIFFPWQIDDIRYFVMPDWWNLHLFFSADRRNLHFFPMSNWQNSWFFYESLMKFAIYSHEWLTKFPIFFSQQIDIIRDKYSRFIFNDLQNRNCLPWVIDQILEFFFHMAKFASHEFLTLATIVSFGRFMKFAIFFFPVVTKFVIFPRLVDI